MVDDVTKQAKAVRTALCAIKTDFLVLQNKTVIYFENATTQDDTEFRNHKLDIIEKSLEKVDLGIDETEILLILSQYLQHLEIDKMRVRLQVKRLFQENEWLKEELSNLQCRLCKLDTDLSTAEAENKHFQFLYEMRKYDATHDSTNTFNKECDKQVEEENDNDDVPPRLRTLHNLVVQYAKEGRYEVAIPLCKQALIDLKKSAGDKHPDVATMLCILGMVYRDQENVKEAIPALEEALRIREQVNGKDSLSLATILSNLAVLMVRRGKFKEAEPLCRRSLNIRIKHLGFNHTDVAKQYNNLALLCQNLQKYDDVEYFYNEAMRIYYLTPETDEASILKTKNNKVAFLVKQQRLEEGEKILKDIINDRHKQDFGEITDSNPSVWMLVESRVKKGAYKAEQVADLLLNRYGRINDPVIQVTLKNLTLIYRKLGKDDQALIMEMWIKLYNSMPPSVYRNMKSAKPKSSPSRAETPPPQLGTNVTTEVANLTQTIVRTQSTASEGGKKVLKKYKALPSAQSEEKSTNSAVNSSKMGKIKNMFSKKEKKK